MALLGLGGAQVFSTASGGKVYAYNAILTVSAQVVAPANSSRQKLTFHNPGAQDLYVFPSVDANGVALACSTAAKGGSFLIFANGGTLVVEGECQTAWQAFAASGTTNPLTVMDSNR